MVPGHSHTLIKAKPNTYSVNHPVSNICDSRMIFWARGLVTALALAGLAPLLLLFLVVVPRYWHLQNSGVSCATGLHFH